MRKCLYLFVIIKGLFFLYSQEIFHDIYLESSNELPYIARINDENILRNIEYKEKNIEKYFDNPILNSTIEIDDYKYYQDVSYIFSSLKTKLIQAKNFKFEENVHIPEKSGHLFQK